MKSYREDSLNAIRKQKLMKDEEKTFQHLPVGLLQMTLRIYKTIKICYNPAKRPE